MKALIILLLLTSCAHTTATKTGSDWTMSSTTLFKDVEGIEVDVKDQVKVNLGTSKVSSDANMVAACLIAPELCK